MANSTESWPQLRIGEEIHEGPRTAVYRARRQSDDRPLIVKILKRESDDPVNRARLDREQSIAALFDSPHVVKAYGLAEHGGRLAILLEDFGGDSLNHQIAQITTLDDALPVAVAVARGLSVIHRAGVVHRDIKPSNVIRRNGETKIADFGSALTRDDMHTQAASSLEGTLAYMAPEQTGRMRRAIDRRADLYSLGVLLYELFTGEAPFRASGALQWMHAHAAQIPRPLTERRASVPPILSQLVLKLLAKDPEERYQSAEAVERDLKRCQELLKADGTIADFALATSDASDEFRLPERVYGRDREMAEMRAMFTRVADTSNGELLLVAGYSGIGKTSLVRELQIPIAARSGYFAAGKFDQYRRHVPYSALAEACDALVHQLLTTSNDDLARWRSTLLQTLDGNGRVLVDLVPHIERVLGPQPEVAELAPTGMQNRLHHSMRAFLRAFAVPVVLFLDDLQWADAASLDLLEALLTQGAHLPLFVVLSYRDHEVGPSHPLTGMIERLRAAGTPIHAVKLGSLDASAVERMVGDTLQSRGPSCAKLASFAMTKTAGNPFFVREFLRTLYLDGLLHFDPALPGWTFDPSAVEARSMTDNVVHLMLERLHQLPPATREALRVGAFLGSELDVADLAAVMRKSPAETAEDLRIAVEKGLLVFHAATARFGHDRIQQAANELTPETEKPKAHLRVGRFLWDRLDTDPLAARVFEVANHLDAAFALITDAAERERMLHLFLLAGRKAKGATAYQQARTYYARASEILLAAAWESRFELAFDVHVALAECDYLAGNLDAAKSLFADLLARARTDLERGRVYYLQIRMFQVGGDLATAAELSIRSFALFGLNAPETDKQAGEAVAEELRVVDGLMGGRPVSERIDDPRMTDPHVRMLVDLLEVSGPPIYMVRPALFSWVALKMVERSLRFGNTEGSCYGYGIYALLRASALGDVEGGYALSQLAIALNEKLGGASLEGCMLHLLGDHVNFWKNPIVTDLPILEKGFAACVRAGDHIYSNYIGFQAPWHLYESGALIAEVEALTEKGRAFAIETKYEAVLCTVRAEQQFLRVLQGKTAKAGRLASDDFDEAAALDVMTKARFGCGVVYLHIVQMIACYTFGDFAGALAAAKLAEPELGAAFSMPMFCSYTFFHALTLAALAPTVDADTRASYQAAIAAHHAELLGWARACPENFADKAALVGAEIARANGDVGAALKLYEEARNAAKSQRFRQYEALANERAASLYKSLGVASVFQAHLRDAYAQYEAWGAAGKAASLAAEAPELHLGDALLGGDGPKSGSVRAAMRQARIATRDPSSSVSSSSTSSTNELDLTSVLQAAQSLSAEILLPRLLPRLMSIVVEYAGAERGSLFFVEGESLVFAAESTLTPVKAPGLIPREGSLPPSQSSRRPGPEHPSSVLRYALRTSDQVVIDDASAPNTFASDPYFRTSGHRSVLCKPIQHQGRVIALLYLENDLVAAAFTPSRLVSLEVLAAQTAVSIENSRLYEASRAAVVARDEFLSIASHELRTPLTPLAIHIHRLTSAIRKGTLRAMPDEALTKLATSCDDQITRLSKLVATLLDVSRIGSGTLYLQRENVDFGTLVAAIVDAHASDAAAAGCSVTVQAEPGIEGHWDKTRLEQVVTNLLTNAFKFGREHSIELKVERSRTSSGGAGSGVELTVADHGPGIKKEDRERVFERFERVASALNVDGIGLGLFIVRAIVTAHEGQVRVRETEGGGSTFCVTLPLGRT